MACEPGYCLHKPTGRAYVNLVGKVVYLGLHGTEESKRKYEQVNAEWLVNRHSERYSVQPNGPTVEQAPRLRPLAIVWDDGDLTDGCLFDEMVSNHLKELLPELSEA
ncbi:MAG: hypothetical protein SFV81_27360 [Pirellulaceae bacterium]|nr:hypothetical protein [Pirellulaceae bacterium]